jgi:hypothetical protein
MLGDDYNPYAGADKSLKWTQFAEKFKPKKGWNKIRLYGLVYSDARHENITTKTGKAYNEFCPGYDVENDTFFDDRKERCACCALDMPYKLRRFVNVLDVDAWEHRPASLTGWNPFYLLEMSGNLHDKLMGLKAHPLNSTGANIGDPVRGALVALKFDPDAPSPANVYDVSILQSGWAFPQEALQIVFSQSTPDGRRIVRKATGNIPAAWEYFGCRNSLDQMRRSLKTHGYIKDDADEAHADVKNRADALRAELEKVSTAPKTNVAKLAQLRSEPDAAPPPPAVSTPEASVDEIPF